MGSDQIVDLVCRVGPRTDEGDANMRMTARAVVSRIARERGIEISGLSEEIWRAPMNGVDATWLRLTALAKGELEKG